MLMLFIEVITNGASALIERARMGVPTGWRVPFFWYFKRVKTGHPKLFHKQSLGLCTFQGSVNISQEEHNCRLNRLLWTNSNGLQLVVTARDLTTEPLFWKSNARADTLGLYWPPVLTDGLLFCNHSDLQCSSATLQLRGGCHGENKGLAVRRPNSAPRSTTPLPRKSSISHVNQLCKSGSASWVFKYGWYPPF